jgi:hypothetical protein
MYVEKENQNVQHAGMAVFAKKPSPQTVGIILVPGYIIKVQKGPSSIYTA